MGGPEASVDAAVCFVEGGNHIAAKSHHLFIARSSIGFRHDGQLIRPSRSL
jgi:hypothetical protein